MPALIAFRHEKSPGMRGFSKCAREDSNLHGPYSPQGPQPCASTNSATGAWAAQYIRGGCHGGEPARRAAGRGGASGAGLSPSRGRASLTNTCSTHGIAAGQTSKELTMDLTKRQREIFDFIKRYS